MVYTGSHVTRRMEVMWSEVMWPEIQDGSQNKKSHHHHTSTKKAHLTTCDKIEDWLRNLLTIPEWCNNISMILVNKVQESSWLYHGNKPQTEPLLIYYLRTHLVYVLLEMLWILTIKMYLEWILSTHLTIFFCGRCGCNFKVWFSNSYYELICQCFL